MDIAATELIMHGFETAKILMTDEGCVILTGCKILGALNHQDWAPGFRISDLKAFDECVLGAGWLAFNFCTGTVRRIPYCIRCYVGMQHP